MADINTVTDRVFVRDRPTVEIRDSLTTGDDWELLPHVFCDRLEERCNGVDVARLSWDFGAAVRQFNGESGPFSPLDLFGKFVRITVPTNPSVEWYGTILSDSLDRYAAKDDGGTMRLQGRRQALQAVGLEYLLDRNQVRSAVVFPPVGGGVSTRLNRAMAFNGGSYSPVTNTEDRRGNRQTAIGPEGVPLFENGRSTATEWTIGDMVEHLLLYHAPMNLDEQHAPASWRIDAGSLSLLQGYRPYLATAGRTVFELLNEILSPRRGYCWWTSFDAVTEEIVLHAQTLSSAAITLPTGCLLYTSPSPRDC